MIGARKLLLPVSSAMDVLSVSLCKMRVIYKRTDDWCCCFYTLCDVFHGNKYVFIAIVIPKLQRLYNWRLGMDK